MTKKEDEANVDEEAEDEDDADYLVVQEAIQISDGAHKGTIENVVNEKRGDQQQYNYIDVYVETENDAGKSSMLKTGFPAYVTENSGLGVVLAKSGYNFVVGDKLDYATIKEQLVGKEIEFTTYTEDKFARIVNKTIRFI